jgi:hypothetical protein
MSTRRGGCLGDLLKLSVLGGVLLYGLVGLTSPWAFHIGGRWTPLLYWSGVGRLTTKGQTYPLFVTLYPSFQFSRLHVDGLRPTGGIGGTASLCASADVVEALNVGGTIFDGWRSTEGALIEFRLLEYRILDVGQRQGYVDLYGRWHGSKLVMDDRGRANGTFRSGLKLERAAIVLEPGNWSEFKAACADGPVPTDRPRRST